MSHTYNTIYVEQNIKGTKRQHFFLDSRMFFCKLFDAQAIKDKKVHVAASNM